MLRWTIRQDSSLIGTPEKRTTEDTQPASSIEPAAWKQLKERLDWQYPFEEMTNQAAKIRVSEFARRAAERPDEEAVQINGANNRVRGGLAERTWREPTRTPGSVLSAAEIGSIHHLFLESVSLDQVGGVEHLRAEARRLEQLGVLKPEHAVKLDFEGIAAFWTSKLGLEILSQKQHVRRELAFTVRFAPDELHVLLNNELGSPPRSEPGSELIVTEGKADLAVILPNEIWVVDFKTDRVTKGEVTERAQLYSAQLKMYARALSEIYQRPVTSCWLYFLAAREAVRLYE